MTRTAIISELEQKAAELTAAGDYWIQKRYTIAAEYYEKANEIKKTIVYLRKSLQKGANNMTNKEWCAARKREKTTENCIYIQDGFNKYGNYERMNYIALILNGDKTGETRNHNRLQRGWIGIAKGNYVYGRVKLGAPVLITRESPEYRTTFIFGTKYDIQPGGSKYYYPILETEDFRANPKPIIRHGNYGLYELANR